MTARRTKIEKESSGLYCQAFGHKIRGGQCVICNRGCEHCLEDQINQAEELKESEDDR